LGQEAYCQIKPEADSLREWQQEKQQQYLYRCEDRGNEVRGTTGKDGFCSAMSKNRQRQEQKQVPFGNDKQNLMGGFEEVVCI
jgi:hypothetical protein